MHKPFRCGEAFGPSSSAICQDAVLHRLAPVPHFYFRTFLAAEVGLANYKNRCDFSQNLNLDHTLNSSHRENPESSLRWGSDHNQSELMLSYGRTMVQSAFAELCFTLSFSASSLHYSPRLSPKDYSA